MADPYVTAAGTAPTDAGTSSISARFQRLSDATKRVQKVHLAPGQTRAEKPGRRHLKVRPALTPEMRSEAQEARAAIKSSRKVNFDAILAQVLLDMGSRPIVEAKRQLARRFAAMCVILEDHERRLLSRARFEPKRYAELVAALTRLGSKLGLNPIGKGETDATPSLGDYLASRADASDSEGGE